MKSMIIIGAGIAGLSAGIYACKNGFDVTIFESHYLPGGLCTAWKRKKYTFEGCLHYIKLVGTAPSHTFYNLYKEIGVLEKIEIIQNDIFHSFRDNNGRTLHLYTDVNKLEEELLSLSPGDAEEINALKKAIKRYSWFIRRTGKNPIKLIKKIIAILSTIPLLKKYGDLDLSEYAARFQDPLIREAFTYLFVRPEFACNSLFFILAGFHLQSSGYPQGSSLRFAQKVAECFVELEGKIEYKKTVKQIIVRNNRAVGITLDNGTIYEADLIISAADAHSTIFEMLEDKYTTSILRKRFQKEPVYSAFIQVSFGINKDLSGTPHAVKAETKHPFEIAGQLRDTLWYHHFAFDPTSAPNNKTALTVLYPSDLDWWEQIGYATERYEQEKEHILETTISQLEQFFPGIAAQVETSDVATPYSTLRFTHNWKASPGFMMTKALAGEMTLKPQYKLPNLENFYMTGQWVKGFGVPMAIQSGKDVIKKYCRDSGQKFKK